MLFAFGIAQFTPHLAQLGVPRCPAGMGVQVALDLMMFVMAVMGGRVIPMFTNNGVPGVQARRNETLDASRSARCWRCWRPIWPALHGAAMAVLLAPAAALHAARLSPVAALITLRTPLVWVLHAAYAFIVLHLALRAAPKPG